MCFHVSRTNSNGEEDLSGKAVRNINTLSVEEISNKLSSEGRTIKNKEDTTFKSIKINFNNTKFFNRLNLNSLLLYYQP